MFDPEWKLMKKNLKRLMHDQLFARRFIDVDVPEKVWQITDDNLRKQLRSFQSSNKERFKIYIKGLVSVENISAGIGVAIYDPRDHCVFKSRKTFLIAGTSRRTDDDVVEIRAYVECLHAALKFGLKWVDIFCDNKSVYQYLTGKDKPRSKTTMTLVDTLILIQRKISYRVRRSRMKVDYAYRLAKEALVENELEQCTICWEHVYKGRMFSLTKCLHRYCYWCMNKHVESRLLKGKLPKCPFVPCWSKFEIKSCKKWLSKELYKNLSLRIKEASIPPTEKVYCPFPKCSALMSRTELQHASGSASLDTKGKRRCSKCHRLFCISCKVPWHSKSTCSDYMNAFPNEFADELELKSLAAENSWRQCTNCEHMIELSDGCNHITCRCGYEFCYNCGAEWGNHCITCNDRNNLEDDLNNRFPPWPVGQVDALGRTSLEPGYPFGQVARWMDRWS